MLREVINVHEEQQSFIDVDVSCNVKKHPRDKEDSDDDSNGEDLLEEILCLKKPRVAGDS